MITFHIDDRQFQRELKSFARQNNASFAQALLKATNDLERMAKLKVRDMTKAAKVKSGVLINNIYKKITNKGLTGEVISGADYSQAYEEGTRPHIIRAKNKKVLAGPLRGAPAGWNISGSSRQMGYATYGKEVKHPGTRPHPFMFPSWKQACANFEKYLKEALS